MSNPVLYADQLRGMDIILLRDRIGSIAGIAVQFGPALPEHIAQFVTKLLTHMVPRIITGLESSDIRTLSTWTGFSSTAAASGIFKVSLILPRSGVRIILNGQNVKLGGNTFHRNSGRQRLN
jgi:hypothetical protein